MNDIDPSAFDNDVAFARLQAADPAVGAAPNLSRIRAQVTAGIEVTPVDEVSKRRSSKRWIAGAAAVVAGAVIIGSGGFALGTVASGSGASGGAGFTSVDAAMVPNSGKSVGFSVPQASPAAKGFDLTTNSALDSARTVISPSNVRFVAASALSAPIPPRNAQAYTFDATGIDVAARAKKLAAAFKIDATPALDPKSSSYRALGRGATVDVALNAAVSFTYGRQSQLLKIPTCGGTAKTPIPVQQGLRTADLSNSQGLADACASTPLSNAAAKPAVSVAKVTMRLIGADPSHYVWTTAGTSSVTVVRATPVIKGNAIGVPAAVWSFHVDNGATVMGVSGSLAPLKSLGGYTLVHPASAVKRLNDPGFSASTRGYFSLSKTEPADGTVLYFGSYIPLPGAEHRSAAGVQPSEIFNAAPVPSTTTPPKTPSAGSRIKWPITKVTIVTARVVLAQYVQSDGSVLVLPTYLLTAKDGSTYSVLALSNESLATASH